MATSSRLQAPSERPTFAARASIDRRRAGWRPTERALAWIGSLLAAVARIAARHTGHAVTFAALVVLCALQALALLRAPDGWMPAAIDIRLAPGEEITLGQRELAAPHGDRHHLSLRRDAREGWILRNLAASKQIVIQRGAIEQSAGSAALQPRDRFQVGGAVFTVSAADGRSVAFSHNGKQWRYDGATLYRDGQAQISCPDARLSTKVLAVWNRLMPHLITVARPLTLGGNLYCGNRLGLENVTPGAAQISRDHGALMLASGNPDGERAAVLVNGADLRKQEIPLAGVTAMIIGHTRFQLAARSSQLTLIPGRQISLHPSPDLKLPAAVEWRWQKRALWAGSQLTAIWTGILVGVTCLVVVAACALGGTQGDTSARQWSRSAIAGSRLLAAVAVLVAGVAAIIGQRNGVAPSAAMSLMLGSCALLLWLALPGRLTLLTAAALTLLAIGLLSQLELGLAAPQTTWLRYYQKSSALLAIGFGLGGLLRLWAYHRRAHAQPGQRAIEWLLALFAAIALAGLAAQVLWGDEGGVFDLQPVELAKLALAALTAHCLALRFGWHSDAPHPADQGARWLRLIAPALLFLALLGMALVQVDDFSPLILLLVWGTVMALSYALIARNHLLAALLIAAGLAASGALAWLRVDGGEDLIRWGFYADRFLVWLNPAEHPHTGQQLLQGAHAVGEGGWLGADHWFGLRSLGQSAGSAVQIPAVQDDFAASFFINRHGLVGALLLWCVQAAFLTGIALAAHRALRSAAAARNYRQAWSARFRYFALCGGGAFVLGHFLLSWGTNLAIFPIMGQPMSFLSAGGSHLLFFLCPLLAFCAISAPSLEGE